MAKSGKGISIGIQDFKYAVLKDDGTYTPFMDVPNVLTVADTPDTKDSKKFYGDNGEIHSVQPTSKTGSLVLSFAHGLNSSFYEEVYG